MPFINVKVSIPLTEEKRIAVKTALGKSIEIMGVFCKHKMHIIAE